MRKSYTLWRFSLVALLSVLGAVSVHAQRRVSDYDVRTFQGSFNSIASTGNVLDFGGSIWFSGYAEFSMPFDFPFDGQTIYAGTTIALTAGGAIDLGGGHPYYGSGLGDGSYPGLLSFFGGWTVTGDGDHGDNNNYYLVTGTAPNRVLTIEARRIHFQGAGGGTGTGGGATQSSIQVKLYEATGNIEYIYRDHNHDFGTDWYGGGCDIGINGLSSPYFVDNEYTTKTSKTPSADIRFYAQPQPQLNVAPRSLQFGSVVAGNTSTFCTTANSIGPGTLHIVSASISGNPDFTISSGPAVGTALATGESVDYCVTFAPITSGTRTAVLTITTDGLDSGQQMVTLTGIGIAPSVNAPVTDIFRKTTVRVGSSDTVAIPLESIGTGALTITGVTITGLNPDQYSVVRFPQNPIAPGAWDSVYIAFNPTFEGRPDATILINSNAVNKPQVAVKTYGIGIMARLAVTPATLSFDSVNIGQQMCKTVTLSNPGSDTVSVLNVLKTGGDYDFTFTPLGSDSVIAPGHQTTFNVCFTPLRSGLRTASIRFYSNIIRTIPDNRDTSQILLEITGTGVPFGNLGFTGTAVDTAIVGIEHCVTDVIKNTGSADITVSSTKIIGADSAEFSFSGLTLPVTISAGQTRTVTYCLTPTERGLRQAALVLTGSSAGTPTSITLPLLGYGVQVCATSTPATAFTTKTPVGMTDTATITVTNCGDVATAYTAALPGNASMYSILGAATTATVAPGSTGTFQVTYTPTTIGANAANLTITGGTGVTPMTVALGGVGAGVNATATGTDAGTVAKGSCQDFTVTITNTGNVDWTPGDVSISGANAGDYTFVSLNPTTITAGGTATLTLKFCPTTTSTETATINFPNAAPTPLTPFSIHLTGTGEVSSVAEVTSMNGYKLGQSYPNPMHKTSDVIVTVPRESSVRLDLVDVTGQVVRNVTSELMTQGTHVVTIDANRLPSGTYYYVLTSGDVRLIRQLVIAR